jgi:hypothetical protein
MTIPSLLRRPRERESQEDGHSSSSSTTIRRNTRRESLSGSLMVSGPLPLPLTTSGTSVDTRNSNSNTRELPDQQQTQTQRPLQPFYEDDSAHADPSLWMEIVPPDTTTNDDDAQDTPRTSRDDRSTTTNRGGLGSILRFCGPTTNNNIIKIPIPSFLCDCVILVFEWTFAAVEVWTDILSAPLFPLATLQKISIVLLGVDRIRDNLDHSVLLVLLHPSSATTTTTTTAAAGMISSSGIGRIANMAFLFSIPHYLVWVIPGVVAILSVSFVLTLQLSWGHQEEAVIATALILLIFLEALLPLFILGCTSMFLFQQVSWETSLVLLFIVWLGSTFCAHCIRRMLYQSLGHG